MYLLVPVSHLYIQQTYLKKEKKALSFLLSRMLYKPMVRSPARQLPLLRNDLRIGINSSSNVFFLLYQKKYMQSGRSLLSEFIFSCSYTER